MPATASALPADLRVVPGDEAGFTLTIRNVGTLVDRFTVVIDGAPGSWAEVTPSALPLLPGVTGEVQVRLRPPRAWSCSAGAAPLVVRIVSEKDAGAPTQLQGSIHVEAFSQTTARLIPENSRGRRKAQHQVTMRNEGNHPEEIAVVASDPDSALAFTVAPAGSTIAAGAAGSATIALAARSRILKGKARPRPFDVEVRTADAVVPLQGTFLQKPLLPRWAMVLGLALIVALAMIANSEPIGGPVLAIFLVLLAAALLVVVLIVALLVLVKKLFQRRQSAPIPPPMR